MRSTCTCYGLQGDVAQYAANQTRNPFSFRYVHWISLRVLHKTRDQHLNVPPEGRSIMHVKCLL